MNKTIIGDFRLGGAEWKLVMDNEYCETNSCRWNEILPKQQLIVTDSYYSSKLNYDVMERFIWDGICTIIAYDVMYLNKDRTTEVVIPFSGLFYQAISTLTSKPGEWDGSFQLGGVSYMVIVDNKRGAEDDFHGRCNPNSKIIYLTTANGAYEYTDDFIYQTLFHEVIHAINAELGRDEHEMNAEPFVNTYSIFLYEVYKKLKIKFPDETDK